jgi:hypothetical protein
MSNSKRYWWVLIVGVCFASCKASRYQFNVRDFASSIRREAAQLAGSKDTTPISKITIYKAEIAEKLVEQNSVSDYRLLNRYSKKDTIPIFVSRYKHEIYLLCFETEDEDRYAVMLTATYDARNGCIGLGGAYAGVFRNRFNDSGFAISHALKIKTSNGKPRTIQSVKQAGEFELDFFADRPIVSWTKSPIRFYKVVQRSKNKIAGLNKELVYVISTVFNDPDALAFSFVSEF